jgi:NAD(P)-dependent dehydrogenase (short-subunit alcohol dehydrogenase family)
LINSEFWSETIPTTLPRTALVTGGARRIGRAIALALADAGFAVAIHCHRSLEQAESVSAQIRKRGGRSAVLRADLSMEKQVSILIPSAQAALGPVGVLVNSASRFEPDEWETVTRESWDAHLEINMRAPFRLIQLFGQHLPVGAEGVVINIVDQRVWSLTPHFISYTAAKAGLWALTQSLALALAPRIRVNAIGPGPALPSIRQTREQFEQQCRSVPLERGTAPCEIARAVLALLAFPSCTGQMIALDGGQHLQWGPGRQDLAIE